MHSSEYKSSSGIQTNDWSLPFDDRQIYYASKRVLDVFFSFFVLFFLSPIILIISILISLDSSGPVFFKQKRVGTKMVRRGKFILWERSDFNCFKFRTMANNTSDEIHKAYIKALIKDDRHAMQEMEGNGINVHKLVNDKRITRIGKYLRKSSLDEVPQFWNVILGNMSLVGPRPNLPYEIELYSPRHFKRLNAQPGITGLQQITARNTASFEEQIDLDIKYIEKQSFWLDIWILLKTPFAIFIQKGA